MILGTDDTALKMKSLFLKRGNMGYKYLGCFSNKKHEGKLGNIQECFDFILKFSVDEVYCSLAELDKKTIKTVTVFCNSHNLALKLIPDSYKLYSKNRSLEYYDDALIVYSVKKIPFEFPENLFIKRCFDIVFSLLVCIFILSWLVPILWVLVRLESKGPLIFKQQREGLNGNQFVCYKFRSMKLNKLSDKVHATVNDSRITKIGGVLRKLVWMNYRSSLMSLEVI